MKLFSKQSAAPELSRQESLSSTPIKNNHVEEKRMPNGEFLIHYPAATTGPLITSLMDKLGRPARMRIKKIQLDGLGSDVWALIDNHRSVQDIIDLFAQRHQLPGKEAEIAVTQFMHALGKRGLIGLK